MDVPGVGEVGRGIAEGVGPDGQDLRYYFTDNSERVHLPSVTSVLSYVDEDKTGLKFWKEKNDGKSDAADWRHIMWYKQHRGTLCHYAALGPLQDGNAWSGDEEQSAWELINLEESPVADDESGIVLYSMYKSWNFVQDKMEFIDHVHNRSLRDPVNKKHCLGGHVEHDMKRFIGHWNEAADVLGIDSDSVVDAERFLFNPEVGAAGQVDLVYDAPDGKRVCADIKTSSSLYLKHKRQAAFYAGMYPDEIDRIEVIKIHPHKGWEVFTPPETEGDRSVLTSKSGRSVWKESRTEMWQHCEQAMRNYAHDGPDMDVVRDTLVTTS